MKSIITTSAITTGFIILPPPTTIIGDPYYTVLNTGGPDKFLMVSKLIPDDDPTAVRPV
jgi:hypothetical protein